MTKKKEAIPLRKELVMVQFTAPREMPMQIWDARQKTGHKSNMEYLRWRIAEALSKDLGVDIEVIVENFPTGNPNPQPRIRGRFAKWTDQERVGQE